MSYSRHAGFTYVGVMVLVAIITVASAATLSVGSAMQQRMHEAELLFIGREFAEAFRSYFDATPAGQRQYPATLAELLRDPRYPGIRRHLRKIYVDPLTGKAEWGLVAAPGGIVGVHSLSQRAPLKVAEFEPAFAALSDKTKYTDWKFGFLPPGLVLPGNPQLAGTLAPIVKPAPQKPHVKPASTPGTVNSSAATGPSAPTQPEQTVTTKEPSPP